MNRWDCHEPGCTSSAVGCGGAIGLRAVGWYFVRGPVLFCPAHRPDKTRNRTELHGPKDRSGPCGVCTGEREAADLQALLEIEAGKW